MLWVKAFHIIFVVCWFAGLFYLPRLFVYHAACETTDNAGNERFKVMERRLYYGITYPSAILTTIFGIWLMSYSFSAYMQAAWMHAKLGLVVLLWIYHLFCGHYRKQFANNNNQHSQRYYRYFNEIPAIILLIIVILVVVKPF